MKKLGPIAQERCRRFSEAKLREDLLEPVDGFLLRVEAFTHPRQPQWVRDALPHGAKEWKRLLRHDPCSYCGEASGGTLDHITPRTSGGDTDNLTGACVTCNGAKHTLPALLFMAKQRGANIPFRSRALTYNSSLTR